MDFKAFLVETNLQEQNNIREIIGKLITNDKTWFSTKNILVGDKSGYWILNYLPGDKNEYNYLVRGMVVKKPEKDWKGDPLDLIKSFPFTRFYNFKEKEADPVDLSNSHMLEKLDGTMVGVAFYEKDYKKPHWHTRKMLSSHSKDLETKTTGFYGESHYLMKIIGDYVQKLKFSPQDVDFTYIFEFIHKASEVMTKYKPEDFGLYLIGGRNLSNHKELSEEDLDKVASRIGTRRPQRWDSVASHDEILKMMKQVDREDFEGFVFRDKETGKRVKIKDPDYVAKHHMLGNASYRRIIPLVFKGEIDEVIANIPYIKQKVEIFLEKFNKYVSKVFEKFSYWRDKKLDKKSLALELFPKEKDAFVNSFIMRNFDNFDDEDVKKKIKETLSSIVLGNGKNAGSPDKLMEIIGLGSDEET